ncbi:MAG: chemotaxis protein CheA, partial [Cyclobacteriaceae bacterium]|nr:chemotaxis protein CheA [Cyclobacteriaceae bacterium]
MDSFINVFKEEAQELIGDLERSLLVLEKNPEDEQSIDQIFRVMHTLKGNSDMFGFEKIEEITHHLENVYDGIRNKNIKITEGILNLTLSTVDHVRVLLKEKENLKPRTLENHNSLRNKLSLLTDGNADSKDHLTNETNLNGEQVKHKTTYFISFKPNIDFLQDGSNPLFLLEDLNELGQTLVIPDKRNIPTLSQLDPTDCYTSWNVILATDHDLQEVLDVFMFAEQNCQLEAQKISDGNLLSNKRFVSHLNELSGKEINSKRLIGLAEKLKKTESENQAKTDNGSSPEDKISSIRVSSDKLDQLMNLVSELVTTQARLNLIAEEIDSTILESLNEDIEKLTRQLRDNTFSICLIPINSIETRFQRLIRDLSKELNKDVTFSIEGGATELDKNIIEGLSEPLLHILRNSMDHGIETSAKRLKAGKDKTGNILLKAYYSGSNVYIEIKDDGAGIDPIAVKKKAIEKGIIGKSHNLSEKELSELIFQSGFSTSQTVTNVSGRGVGMDAVKRKIESIQGEVGIKSEKGSGTTVTIKLPLTLSIMDGLLVSVNQTQFVLPISIIEKLYAIEKDKIADTFNHLVVLDGEQVQFLNLREEFEMGGAIPDINQVVMIKYGDKKFGLIFDKLEGEYQAVLKPLGKLFKYQEFISGATILGDGSVALVLDTNKII